MTVIQRVKIAINNNRLCYWRRPQNLSVDAFKAVMATRHSEIEGLTWDPREADCHNHPDHIPADDKVFKGHITVEQLGQKARFYVKGFFWKKTDRIEEKGVTIQSFKKD